MRVYIDLETTGLVPQRDHIIEVAAVAVEENSCGSVHAIFESLVRPPPDVLERMSREREKFVSGITADMLYMEPMAEEVAPKFQKWVDDLPTDECITYHSYNVQFDSNFLAMPPWNFPPGAWDECVMKAVAAFKNPASGRWLKLGAAAAAFKIEWPPGDTPHRARADAFMAARVHMALLKERAERAARL